MPPFKYKPVAPPLKWHGGKFYLAEWIISLMPPRGSYLHYVEPYFGGGSVLLRNDPEGISEVANDLNRYLTCFWSVLQSDRSFRAFQRAVSAKPFSEAEWERAGEDLKLTTATNPLEPFSLLNTSVRDAVAFFVHCRQSYAGRMKEFTSVTKRRTRGGMNAEVSAWLSCVEGLPQVYARMRRVLILNRPALEVIRSQDGPETLFYLDPPYLHSTRVTTGEYDCEMTTEDHAELLDVLAGVKGKFMLSGYPSVLYGGHAQLNGWNRHEKSISNNASSARTKPVMTECVWTNY